MVRYSHKGTRIEAGGDDTPETLEKPKGWQGPARKPRSMTSAWGVGVNEDLKSLGDLPRRQHLPHCSTVPDTATVPPGPGH